MRKSLALQGCTVEGDFPNEPLENGQQSKFSRDIAGSSACHALCSSFGILRRKVKAPGD